MDNHTTKSAGRISAIFGNMVVAEMEASVKQNAVAYCRRSDGATLLSEVIRIRGHHADLQVFEETRGLRVGDPVEFTDKMLSARLGPGLLGQVYDGLQNPLKPLSEHQGYFLNAGLYLPPLSDKTRWNFTPRVRPGDRVRAGDTLGSVPEGIFLHRIMVPFNFGGWHTVEQIAVANEYTVADEIALLRNPSGELKSITMQQEWPVKAALNVSRRRLMPQKPLITRVRIIDTLFPIALGGTYCIPGPFGAGKTVLQQITARHAEVDIVIVAACGERAGEVVDILREFPELIDPRTGRSLMERTIIICNTSSMPVAAREASVYMAVTLAEYYRQMGLHTLLLADSTSRWAQAMREISGRLEEIPGEEAFPAYLESRIAGFYERAGIVELHDGSLGSVTIGGTVSPAGGNFEEPVTQGTLKVVGAFHGLSSVRSDARRYPAIDPLDSWSKYPGIIDAEKRARASAILKRGREIRQMMTVVGEDGTSAEDFSVMLKADFFDNCYLQQNAFDSIDGATPSARQKFVFDRVLSVMGLELSFDNKEDIRRAMVRVANLFRNWNYAFVSPDDLEGGVFEAASYSSGSFSGDSDFFSILHEIDHFLEENGSRQAVQDDSLGQSEEAVV